MRKVHKKQLCKKCNEYFLSITIDEFCGACEPDEEEELEIVNE